MGRDVAEQMAQFKALSDEIKGLQDTLDERESDQVGRQNHHSRINEMIEVLQNHDLRLAEYDDRLVKLTVERIKVLDADKVLVEFGPGVEYVCGVE